MDQTNVPKNSLPEWIQESGDFLLFAYDNREPNNPYSVSHDSGITLFDICIISHIERNTIVIDWVNYFPGILHDHHQISVAVLPDIHYLSHLEMQA
jgi:hypothetical protein